MNYLKQSSDLHEMHELFCYLRLNERLSTEQASEIGETLEVFMDHCISRDPGTARDTEQRPLALWIRRIRPILPNTASFFRWN